MSAALQQAMRRLKQKAQLAEASRFRYEQTKTDDYRRAAEFGTLMLIGAALDVVREWEHAKMPTLGELLGRERQTTATVVAGGQ